MKPQLYIIALVVMILVTIWVWRKQRPPHELIYLAMLPLFCITTPQINYFNMRQLLIIHHLSDPLKTRNQIGLFLLFVIEAVTQYAMVERFTRYAVTSITSIGLTIYFVIMLATMLLDTIVHNRQEGWVQRLCSQNVVLSGIYATVCSVVYGAVLMQYWAYGEQHSKKREQQFEQARKEQLERNRAAQTNTGNDTLDQLKSQIPEGSKVGMMMPYEKMQDVKESGDNWRRNAVVIPKGYDLMIPWREGITKTKKIDLSFDNNDTYVINYLHIEKTVAIQPIRKPPGGAEKGLQQMVIDVPQEAIDKGYDRVIIAPNGGDGRYSIGHFVLVDPVFESAENKANNDSTGKQKDAVPEALEENKTPRAEADSKTKN